MAAAALGLLSPAHHVSVTGLKHCLASFPRMSPRHACCASPAWTCCGRAPAVLWIPRSSEAPSTTDQTGCTCQVREGGDFTETVHTTRVLSQYDDEALTGVDRPPLAAFMLVF